MKGLREMLYMKRIIPNMTAMPTPAPTDITR